jgi:short-subunit dehydrogenase
VHECDASIGQQETEIGFEYALTDANRGLGLEFVTLLLVQGARKIYAGRRIKAEINIAGIARVLQTAQVDSMIDQAREIFETNFYRLTRVTQGFAPILRAKGGGAVINVLSDMTWIGRPLMAAPSATKSAAWSYTYSTRVELRARGTQVLALHMASWTPT